jgi:hypothetical protein
MPACVAELLVLTGWRSREEEKRSQRRASFRFCFTGGGDICWLLRFSR